MLNEAFILRCEFHLEKAREYASVDYQYEREQHLVKLRQLLNDQPELEAGGSLQNPN